jgi:hypothetical protein
MKNNYSINEILIAVDKILDPSTTKVIKNEIPQQINKSLPSMNKEQPVKIVEKINKQALILKNIIDNQDALLLTKFFTTNNPLILK